MKRKLILIFLLVVQNLLSKNTPISIPFVLTDSGHILIEAEINKVKGSFILDTGAGINVVFRNFSNKINHSSPYSFFVGHRATGEPLSLDLYRCNELKIGVFKPENQHFSILDMDFGEIDGLISLQAFEKNSLTIDYEKKHLIIDEKVNLKKSKIISLQVADYAGNALDVFTEIKINNSNPIQILLDSGAGKNSFWFNSRYLRELNLNISAFEKFNVKSNFVPSQSNDFYFGKVDNIVTLESISQKKDVTVTFIDGLIYGGKTSIDWLGKKITIDLKKKKLYIEN